MLVPGSDTASPGRDILGLELMSEGIETHLEKKKANGLMFGSNFILSEIFISEWTLSLMYHIMDFNWNYFMGTLRST